MQIVESGQVRRIDDLTTELNGDHAMWQPKRNSFLSGSVPIRTTGNAGSRHLLLNQLFEKLGIIAIGGFSAGLHIGCTPPLVYVKSYPADWQKQYDDNAYMLRDPVIFWGLAVKGATRWSEIRLPDPFDILGKAKKHGLNFGAVISAGPISSRSIVGISRPEREFTDTEIEAAAEIVRKLHDAAAPPSELTDAQTEALRLLSVGYRHTAAAAELGISESALKARLKSAKIRLGAQTTVEAVKLAREYRFI